MRAPQLYQAPPRQALVSLQLRKRMGMGDSERGGELCVLAVVNQGARTGCRAIAGSPRKSCYGTVAKVTAGAGSGKAPREGPAGRQEAALVCGQGGTAGLAVQRGKHWYMVAVQLSEPRDAYNPRAKPELPQQPLPSLPSLKP